MKLIAVYGSLRSGFYNHPYFLKEAEFTEFLTVNGYLKDLGAYPALVESPSGHDVEVEVYKVEPAAFESIDSMEQGAGYYPSLIPTSQGDATIWYMPPFDLLGERTVAPDEDGVVRWKERE